MKRSRINLTIFALVALTVGFSACGSNETATTDPNTEKVQTSKPDTLAVTAPPDTVSSMQQPPKAQVEIKKEEKPTVTGIEKLEKPAEKASEKKNNVAASESSAAPAAGVEEGKQLIAKADCLGCHKVDTKLVGPAYKEVAEKYASNNANVDMLAAKVINGGTGVWGQIPMAPHPSLSQDDAKNMVRYILSLR